MQEFFKTLQTAEISDIIFTVIAYSYQPFGKKVLPNVLPV